MKTTLMTTAALALSLALVGQAVHAQGSTAQLKREHARAVAAGDWANDPYDSRSSDNLNQQQLQMAQGASPVVSADEDMNGAPPPAAQPMASDDTTYSSDQNYNSQTNETLVIPGPAHDATEADPAPTTNPQSAGTPSVDTPYVTTVPAGN